MHCIVVIDDEEVVASIIATLLRRHGYRAETANSGRAGLQLIEELKPALVICDMRLPDIPGDEVVRTLRMQEHTQHIPILIISAYSHQHCVFIGNAFLEKPFRVQQLLDTVRFLIQAEPPGPEVGGS